MKRFLWPVITLLVTAFLVTLFSFPAGEALASAAGHRPRPTPTPSPTPPTPSPTPVSSGGVNFQTNGNLNPGNTVACCDWQRSQAYAEGLNILLNTYPQ